jgi:V/A-type H+-transporting ATPase subunit A
MSSGERDGTVIRVSGSLVVARAVPRARMYDLVEVGERRLTGEIVRLEGERASIQVYEDTTGIRVGEPVVSTASPLQVELGPGLLGGVFDGIERPLPALAETTGPFIAPGAALPALDRERRWPFTPSVSRGDPVREGSVLGEVDEAGVRHLILVPPAIEGKVAQAESREARLDEPVVVLESGAELTLAQRWPMRVGRPHRGKLPHREPLLTGQRAFDTFFPVARGGTAVVPGGFGTGKTVVEHLLAKYAAVDIIVYIGCGERGNEMTALLSEFPQLSDPRTGRSLLSRTVLIANTSNMPVAAREASIYVGITIAEYFRDMGYDVAVMADSTSRWAEALREMSSRLGEMPGEEGYPPYLAARLASFYERAGTVRCLGAEGDERQGSVTIVSAVSPPGGDFSEPVTQASLRVGGTLWALDAGLAERRHFPAVSWTESYSLYVPELAAWFSREIASDWADRRQAAMRVLEKERELRQVVAVVGADALPDDERLTLQTAELLREGFLRQDGFHPVDARCPAERQTAMLSLFLGFYEEARSALKRGVPLEEILRHELWLTLRRIREASHESFPTEAEAVGRKIESLRGMGT